MIDPITKKRWRRSVHKRRRQVENIGSSAEEGLERHFFKRLSRLTQVRRFIASWVLLFILLIVGVLFQARSLGSYYLEAKPTDGGVFTEGVVGTFTNANPIYSAGSVDGSVARLLFSGLFKFNEQHQLVGDLAARYTVDERGTTYTVYLRPDLKWQDGVPITSADVLYTYRTIQNPDAKSPLAASWQGVKVESKGNLTVVFSLPNSLSAFPMSMTNGIVPRHLLEGVPPSQLRSVGFNTNRPVGSGPFKWEAIEVLGSRPEEREQRVALVPNDQYHGQIPRLERFIIRTYLDDKKLLQALKDKEITAAAGLDALPEVLESDISYTAYNVPLSSGVFLFFKNSSEVFKEVKVRRALSFATDINKILADIKRPVLPLRGPLLRSQLGYDKTFDQQVNNAAEAGKLLDEAGWKLGPNGVRVNAAGQSLTFRLVTQRNTTYDYVANALKQQWKPHGIELEVSQLDDDEMQSALAFHNYDALLYGIALGSDPDVFPYWHSSQADIRSSTRFNFSEYKSAAADKALEAGRTRSDAALRSVKYRPFLEAWRNDAPAIALYQPRYLYVVYGKLYGFNPANINTGQDRYANVENWMIREDLQPIH